MERQTVLLSAALFVLLSVAGFYVGFLMEEPEESGTSNESFSKQMNVTADAGKDVVTANFDGRSIDLMHEDRKKAIFYLDLDQDGSFDIELDGLTHDGKIRETREAVVVENKTYRFDFRYQDDADKSEDSWITLYRVSEQ